MKKMIKSTLILLVVILISTGCSKKEYIKDINLDKFKEMVANKETFAVYVGNEDCSHCTAYMPTLLKVLEDYDITIYHVDNSQLTEKELGEFSTYVNITGTPTIAFLVEGEEKSTLSRISGQVSEEQTIKKFKSNGYIK